MYNDGVRLWILEESRVKTVPRVVGAGRKENYKKFRTISLSPLDTGLHNQRTAEKYF